MLRHILLLLCFAVLPAVAAEALPGEAAPAAPAEPIALVFTWDHYRSVAVVGDGIGPRRPAWIGTWDTTPVTYDPPGPLRVLLGLFGYDHAPAEAPLAVAYRAIAFRDGRGRLHLVAKGSALAGPQADQWSPDSFLIDGDHVVTIDDNANGNHGTVTETIIPPAERYQELLLQLQVLCGDGI
jgi:hypothetical protein